MIIIIIALNSKNNYIPPEFLVPYLYLVLRAIISFGHIVHNIGRVLFSIPYVKTFNSIKSVFESLLEHELNVTDSINNVVDLCLSEKDYTTHNFMQWYVSEQLEEEALARTILDKLKMIGNDKGGLYMFDRDLDLMVQQMPNDAQK